MMIIYGLRRLALVALTVLASACTSAPQHYFHAVETLQIDGKTVTAESTYHCEEQLEGPNFGPGGLLKGQTRPYGYVPWHVFSLQDGSAVLVRGAQVCQAGDFGMTLYWINSTEGADRLEEFSSKRWRGTQHVITSTNSHVEESASRQPDTRHSPEMERVWKQLLDSKRQFQRVIASVGPDSLMPDDLREQLGSQSGVVLAPVRSDGRNLFQKELIVKQRINDYRSLLLPFAFDGAQWVQADLPPTEAAEMVRIMPPDTPAPPPGYTSHPTSVRYRNKVFKLQWQQEVYDADAHIFILFTNVTNRLP